MQDSADGADSNSVHVAAPRHLRRRWYRSDIAGEHFVGLPNSGLEQPLPQRQYSVRSKQAIHDRKRRAALVVVILVALSIPVLGVTLILIA